MEGGSDMTELPWWATPEPRSMVEVPTTNGKSVSLYFDGIKADPAQAIGDLLQLLAHAKDAQDQNGSYDRAAVRDALIGVVTFLADLGWLDAAGPLLRLIGAFGELDLGNRPDLFETAVDRSGRQPATLNKLMHRARCAAIVDLLIRNEKRCGTRNFEARACQEAAKILNHAAGASGNYTAKALRNWGPRLSQGGESEAQSHAQAAYEAMKGSIQELPEDSDFKRLAEQQAREVEAERLRSLYFG